MRRVQESWSWWERGLSAFQMQPRPLTYGGDFQSPKRAARNMALGRRSPAAVVSVFAGFRVGAYGRFIFLQELLHCCEQARRGQAAARVEIRFHSLRASDQGKSAVNVGHAQGAAHVPNEGQLMQCLSLNGMQARQGDCSFGYHALFLPTQIVAGGMRSINSVGGASMTSISRHRVRVIFIRFLSVSGL